LKFSGSLLKKPTYSIAIPLASRPMYAENTLLMMLDLESEVEGAAVEPLELASGVGPEFEAAWVATNFS
jgi:hypothetical protein